MRQLVLGFVVFGLLGCSHHSSTQGNSSHEQGQNKSGIQLEVFEKTLDNGLKVLVVENKKLPVFSFYSYYKVGSKFEKPGTTGSSHLLEHMMFKGGKKYGANAFDEIVSGNGGRNNAYTTNDLTVYYEMLPSEHFEIIADVEADRMQNLLLEKESFEKERYVVLEERKLRYENSDRGKLYLQMMKELFVGTPYGSSVIGEVEDLKTVSRDKVWDYFKKFYAPNNAVILVVGDVDHDDVFSVMEDKFGDIKPNKELKEQKKKLLGENGFDFKVKLPKRIALKGTSPNPNFYMTFKGIKIGTREGFALDILSSVLGDGESSYLNRKFVLGNNPKLSGVYAANMTLQESGAFFIGGQLLEKVNQKKFESELKETLNKSCDEALSMRAIQKVKNQYLFAMVNELDTNSGIAEFLGNREVYYGDYNFYKKETETYDSITIEELKAVCEKYIKGKDALTLTIWNKN